MRPFAFLAMLLWLASDVFAKPVLTVRPQYPNRGLDSLSQVLWSSSLEGQRDWRKRGWIQDDPEIESFLSAVLLTSGEIDTAHFDFQTRLMRSASINATASPNGFICVHSTMMCFLDNEAELASLLGHEWIHVLRQHSRQSAGLDSLLARRKFWAEATLGLTDRHQKIRKQETGFTRANEVEADSLGLLWSIRQGYDPEAAIRLFSRLDSFSVDFEGEAYELMADHKNMGERITDFRRMIGQRAGGQLWRVTTPEAFLAMQRRLFPDCVRAICTEIEEALDDDRPDSAGHSDYLDTFLRRMDRLDLPLEMRREMLLRRDLALHGARDSSLVRVERDLEQACAEFPAAHVFRLLRANALERLERLTDALELYRALAVDPTYTGRKGMLTIRIQRLEKAIQSQTNSKEKRNEGH